MQFGHILLIQPMHEKQDNEPRSKRESIAFPWGLGYLAKTLQMEGYRVSILDGQALQIPKEKITERIAAYGADIIGISAFSTQFGAVRHITKWIKGKLGVPVLVGGPLAIYQPELPIEATLADVTIMGEGEIITVDLLKNWDNKQDVLGICYRGDDGKPVKNAPQTQLVELDDLPMPDFSLFEMDIYLKSRNPYAMKGHAEGRSMVFFTSRGCPFTCFFCSKSSKTYRAMSPDKIISMLNYLKSEFQVDQVVFDDELFFVSKKHFTHLAPMLKPLGLRWGAQARVNIMDDDFLELAKASGCVGVGYGIESGSQKILDNMNKRTSVQQIEDALVATMKSGLAVKAQLLFGFPGEDEKTVQETVDMFDRIDHPGRRFVVLVPLPGSQVYYQAKSQGKIGDEAEYLAGIEKAFGWGKVHVNMTEWPDDEIYPRKLAAEQQMIDNYNSKSIKRLVKHNVNTSIISAKRSALGIAQAVGVR